MEQGQEDMEALRQALVQDGLKLRKEEEDQLRRLGQLERAAMASTIEANACAAIQLKCDTLAGKNAADRAGCDRDMKQAQPLADQCELSVAAIKPSELNELKDLSKPTDIVKLVFDCVALLRQEAMVFPELTEITLGIGKEKKTQPFITDSFKGLQTSMLADPRFLPNLSLFNKVQKEHMNEETVEFLAPYLALDGFTPLVARGASKACEQLCAWVRAMLSWFDATKAVKPRLEALRVAEAALADERLVLDAANAKLEVCADILTKLREDFEVGLARKKQLAEAAAVSRRKLDAASALFEGLAHFRERSLDSPF